MSYSLAIFDMDGTILNTLEDLTCTLNYTLKKYGFPVHTVPEVRNFIGNGVKNLIKCGAPDKTDDEVILSMYKDFTEYYKVHCTDKTAPYNGIIDLITTLREKGIKTAVISNKADYAVKLLCEKYFNGLFDAVFGERVGVPKKPAPDAVYEMMKILNTDKKETVYIGDSEVDVETARNSGLDCIIVNWGYSKGDIHLSKKGEYLVETTREISNIILNN